MVLLGKGKVSQQDKGPIAGRNVSVTQTKRILRKEETETESSESETSNEETSSSFSSTGDNDEEDEGDSTSEEDTTDSSSESSTSSNSDSDEDGTDDDESSRAELAAPQPTTTKGKSPQITTTISGKSTGRVSGDHQASNKKIFIRDKNNNKLGKSVGGGDQGNDKDEKPHGHGKKRRKKRPLTICLTHCRYELVKSMSKRYELVEVPEDTAWNVYWTDYSVSLERAVEMRRFQIVNHFPGMNEICRKDLLARNLNRMKRVFPEEYNIYPMTWCLPADNNELQAYSSSRRGKTYICKPDMGCQGRGIFLVKNIKDVNPLGRIVCQIYIQKPFLIDHLKFDLRIYVLITSCDPLRIWVFEEGLARFATAKYRLPTHNNTENSYMHLTNYAVNKFSRDFVVDEDTGTKRKLTNVMNWLAQRGYDVETLEKEINDVIIKTILSAQPTLKHHYRTCFPHHDICSACFEILGFDVLIDHKLKPFVIEVNHSPSFHTDTALDREIKESLLKDTFAMLNFKVLDRGMIEREDRRRVQQRITNMLSEANAGTKKEVVKKEVTKKGGNNSSTTTATPTSTRFPHPGRGGKKDESSEQTAKDKKERRKEDYDELAFQWELDNCGRYRLVYPTDDSAKYDKFLAQNQVSLYQDTAASQARASLTKQKIEEYNVKKQIEEQKRVGSIGSNVTTITSSSAGIIVNQVKESHSKEKVRPESSGKSGGYEPMKKSNSNTKPVHSSFLPTNPSNGSSHRGFTLSHIVSKDECDRVRGLIQRGLLIRSLGIELQAYQLLCKVGGLKKMEHDEFRRKHGFVLPNTGGLVTGFNNSSSRPHSNSTIPPKFYMKLNQFSVDTSGSSNLNDNSHSNNFTARTQGNTQAMAHNFGNFIRRERATTSHSYRL